MIVKFGPGAWAKHLVQLLSQCHFHDRSTCDCCLQGTAGAGMMSERVISATSNATVITSLVTLTYSQKLEKAR